VAVSLDETLEAGATIFVGSPKWSISMATLQYVLIIHEVENYESWKKGVLLEFPWRTLDVD
jgi:hypothetical protein